MPRKVYLIYSMYACRTMTFRISKRDGHKLYYQHVKYLLKWSWKVCVHVKIAGFWSASDDIGFVRPRHNKTMGNRAIPD